MYAFAGLSRHWVVDRLGLAELVRPPEHGANPRPNAVAESGLAPEVRLRIATIVALTAGVLFLPLEARAARTDVLTALLALYAFHTVLSSFLLIASHTAWGARHADRLALVLVVGHIADLHLYVYLWPVNPGLAGGIIGCLLVGCTALFTWSTRRVFLLAATTCVTFALVVQEAVPPGADRAPSTVATLVLAVAAATALGSARLLSMLRTALSEREADLAALSARLMSAQEEERRRLARELHDELGQSLTAVNSYLWLIEHQPPADPAALLARTAEARRVVAETLAAMRELSQLLRPPVLDDFGLVPSLDEHLKAFSKRYGIKTSLVTDGLPERLSAEVETALYRIAQEALTNVVRHARATRVRIALAAMGGELRLEIEDDGIGLPKRDGERPSGTGLIGIRERARSLGGTVRLSSRKGTRLSVRVPV